MALLFTGPPITVTTSKNASAMTSLQTGPFHIQSPAVSTFNQQLWLTAKIATDIEESKFLTLDRSRTQTYVAWNYYMPRFFQI